MKKRLDHFCFAKGCHTKAYKTLLCFANGCHTKAYKTLLKLMWLVMQQVDVSLSWLWSC